MNGCGFVGQSKAGLVNHMCQRHGRMVEVMKTCPFCNRMFGSQGIIMYMRFCPERT